MEDEDHSSSYMATQTSVAAQSISPSSSLNSLMDTISVSSVSLETAVKKVGLLYVRIKYVFQ